MTDLQDLLRRVEVPRWSVVINYRSDGGTIDVHHAVEELEEVADLVERGPDWNTIETIVIRLQRTTGRMTLEEADHAG